MTKKNLRGHVADWYRAEAPPPQLVHRLRDLARAGTPTIAGKRRDRRWMGALAMAAAVVLAYGFREALGSRPWRAAPVETSEVTLPLLRELAGEMAAHHKYCPAGSEEERLPLEDPSRSMDRLGFAWIHPARLRQAGVTLVQGRRCVLRGQPVAEIRVQAPDGRSGTLYLARRPEGMGEGAVRRFEIDGLTVELWPEAGLLVGMAMPA